MPPAKANQTGIDEISYSEKFKQDYKKLKPDVKKHTEDAIRDLLKKPIPKSLRLKKYKGHSNPSVYAIHVTSNHSHKISLEINGNKAILRRIGTHKEVDNSP
ncbi:MAG: hypothetical protein JSR51_00455 [Proteobacteria bacterium]|nr:hypothetical protein [Pseudomonadota bacterium]